MKNTPTLEEVKAYFKDAKEVKDWAGDVTVVDIENIKLSGGGDSYVQHCFKKDHLVLWFEKKGGYAEILTHKEPTYTITKEIIEKYEMKDEFPEVFAPVFELNKWYRNDQSALFHVSSINENNKPLGYGFSHCGVFVEDEYNQKESWSIGGLIEATEKEVSDALIAEARNRGFVNGVRFTNTIGGVATAKNRIEVYCYKDGMKLMHGDGTGLIFDNGIWATIIKPKQMSQCDIEKELGYKIEIM